MKSWRIFTRSITMTAALLAFLPVIRDVYAAEWRPVRELGVTERSIIAELTKFRAPLNEILPDGTTFKTFGRGTAMIKLPNGDIMIFGKDASFDTNAALPSGETQSTELSSITVSSSTSTSPQEEIDESLTLYRALMDLRSHDALANTQKDLLLHQYARSFTSEYLNGRAVDLYWIAKKYGREATVLRDYLDDRTPSHAKTLVQFYDGLLTTDPAFSENMPSDDEQAHFARTLIEILRRSENVHHISHAAVKKIHTHHPTAYSTIRAKIYGE